MFWPSTNLMTSSILFFVAQHRRDGVIESLDALDERRRNLRHGVHHEARAGNRQMPWEHGDLPHDLVSLAAHRPAPVGSCGAGHKAGYFRLERHNPRRAE